MRFDTYNTYYTIIVKKCTKYNNKKRSRENIIVKLVFGPLIIGRPLDSCSTVTRSQPAPPRPALQRRTSSGGGPTYGGAGRAHPRTSCARSPTARRPSPSAPPCAPAGQPDRTGAAVPRAATRRKRTPTGQVCRRPSARNRPPCAARLRSTVAVGTVAGTAGEGAPTCRPRLGRPPEPGRHHNRNRPRIRPWLPAPTEPPAHVATAAVAASRPLLLPLPRFRQRR